MFHLKYQNVHLHQLANLSVFFFIILLNSAIYLKNNLQSLTYFSLLLIYNINYIKVHKLLKKLS